MVCSTKEYKRKVCRIFGKKSQGKGHYKVEKLDRWLILRWILEREARVVLTALN
jgi:hypothetical protein